MTLLIFLLYPPKDREVQEREQKGERGGREQKGQKRGDRHEGGQEERGRETERIKTKYKEYIGRRA